jgi:hypothetical protein
VYNFGIIPVPCTISNTPELSLKFPCKLLMVGIYYIYTNYTKLLIISYHKAVLPYIIYLLFPVLRIEIVANCPAVLY